MIDNSSIWYFSCHLGSSYHYKKNVCNRMWKESVVTGLGVTSSLYRVLMTCDINMRVEAIYRALKNMTYCLKTETYLQKIIWSHTVAQHLSFF